MNAAPNIKLNALPSVEAIEQGLQGAEPIETAIRQSIGFGQLSAEVEQRNPFHEQPAFGAVEKYKAAQLERFNAGRELLAKSMNRKPGSPEFEREWRSRIERASISRNEVFDVVARVQNPPPPPEPPEAKTKKNMAGWIMIVGASGLTALIVGFFNRRAAPKSISAAPLASMLPAELGMSLSALHLNIERRWETTQQWISISGNTGTVQQSGRRYSVYDFGYSVTNRSPRWLRFQMKLSKLGSDGHYQQHDRYSWIDLGPNESRRMLFGLDMRGASEFINHQVTEIAVGPTPPGGANQGAHFEHVINPRVGLRQLLQCDALGLWSRPKLGLAYALVVLVASAVAVVLAMRLLETVP